MICPICGNTWRVGADDYCPTCMRRWYGRESVAKMLKSERLREATYIIRNLGTGEIPTDYKIHRLEELSGHKYSENQSLHTWTSEVLDTIQNSDSNIRMLPIPAHTIQQPTVAPQRHSGSSRNSSTNSHPVARPSGRTGFASGSTKQLNPASIPVGGDDDIDSWLDPDDQTFDDNDNWDDTTQPNGFAPGGKTGFCAE